MRGNRFHMGLASALMQIAIAGVHQVEAQPGAETVNLDTRVKAFLDGARYQWKEWNVPYEDGQILHELVVQNGFKNILEIGTSTGHSAIWLAWAASKTGGRVITIEVNRNRYENALENFRKAGVNQYIDARPADGHELVKALPGSFDFVFSDADKEWYPQYFKDLDPKIRVNGCFAAHNVLRSWAPQIEEFLAYVKARPNYRTRIERGSGEGISISCKTSE